MGEGVGGVMPVGAAAGEGLGDGVPAGSDGAALGATAGLGLGAGVGFGVGFGVGLAVGLGVGLGVAFGVGAGVGGAVIVTDPPPSDALNRSRLIASNVTACVPTGSLPDQVKRTPFFQSPPAVLMACVASPTRTRTHPAGDPSRLR
jgi:hypothetical protein